MINGELSNKAAYTIGVRVDGSLFNYKKSNIFSKVKGRFTHKKFLGEANERMYTAVQYLCKNSVYGVVLVVDVDYYTKDLLKKLENIAYQDIILIISEEELAYNLNTHRLDIEAYTDFNDERMARLNSNIAVNIGILCNIAQRSK